MIFFYALFFLSSCLSNEGQIKVAVPSEEVDPFLSRPRFQDAQLRPLGRFLLIWETEDAVREYEIQMSTSEDFSVIEKTWTLYENSLEIGIGDKKQHWLRVRSVNALSTSAWSVPLSIKES